MKKIEAVIASEKVGVVVDALKNVGVGGLTVLDAKGCSAGDGKIFVTTVNDAIDIGSKQKGIHAI
ncbi:MAG: P-II family nitrogen regulator [Nitrosopumilaceae archaeon]